MTRLTEMECRVIYAAKVAQQLKGGQFCCVHLQNILYPNSDRYVSGERGISKAIKGLKRKGYIVSAGKKGAGQYLMSNHELVVPEPFSGMFSDLIDESEGEE